MNENDKAGQPVFGGRVDDVLADKIISHSRQTAQAEPASVESAPVSPELSEPFQEKPRKLPRKRVLFSVSTLVLIGIGLLCLFLIMRKKGRK